MDDLEKRDRRDRKLIASLGRKIKYEHKKTEVLLENIKREMPSLEKILEAVEADRGEEDRVYRFYHESYKCYRIQELTQAIYQALERISPYKRKDKKIQNPHYKKIIQEGMTNREFKNEDNQNWDQVTRPMFEAFFHSKYFLEMAIKYGKQYNQVPRVIGYGFAALMDLYDLRTKVENYTLIMGLIKQRLKEREKKT